MQADQGKQDTVSTPDQEVKSESRDYWFEREKLGILWDLVETAMYHTLKKKRAEAFRGVVKVLKGLKLLPADARVTRMAIAVDTLGVTGFVVSTSVSTRLLVELPTQSKYAQEQKR